MTTTLPTIWLSLSRLVFRSTLCASRPSFGWFEERNQIERRFLLNALAKADGSVLVGDDEIVLG